MFKFVLKHYLMLVYNLYTSTIGCTVLGGHFFLCSPTVSTAKPLNWKKKKQTSYNHITMILKFQILEKDVCKCGPIQ